MRFIMNLFFKFWTFIISKFLQIPFNFRQYIFFLLFFASLLLLLCNLCFVYSPFTWFWRLSGRSEESIQHLFRGYLYKPLHTHCSFIKKSKILSAYTWKYTVISFTMIYSNVYQLCSFNFTRKKLLLYKHLVF